MCKFESSQKGESRAQSADPSKATENLELLIVKARVNVFYFTFHSFCAVGLVL